MVMPADVLGVDRGRRLADPRLRRDVEAVVRRRVRSDDADDVVQAALADVLSAARVPDDAEEFRRFVFAVTRNKVFDHFRRRAREVPEDEAHEASASEEPLSARDMLRWAEGKLPDSDAQHTLEWMLREGDGEKLEQIARDANVPAPRVRQRVSRLRRFLRERWAAELMLAGLGAALLAPLAVFCYHRWLPAQEIAEHPELRPEPPQTPEERGRLARRDALRRCDSAAPEQCLEWLDDARSLDPAGDSAAEVVNARRAAAVRLAPPAPVPSTSSSATSPASSSSSTSRGPTAPAHARRFAIGGGKDNPRSPRLASTESSLTPPPMPKGSSELDTK